MFCIDNIMIGTLFLKSCLYLILLKIHLSTVLNTFQNIIMYEFLPAMLNVDDPIGPYEGYHPDLPSGISHLFSAAAFR